MDATNIFQALLAQLWWIFPLAFVIGFFKSPFAKGYAGELVVRLALFYLKKEIYRPLHNLTLPTVGGTTQIDHVYVSPYGIFVLETKNMNGWIFGGEHQAEWTQKFFRRTFRFQNPLRQNFKHVKALEAVRLAPSLSSDRQHIRHLNTRDDPTPSRLCPRCGSAMVLRTAKRGGQEGRQFWGCSGYPKCKAVQNIG